MQPAKTPPRVKPATPVIETIGPVWRARMLESLGRNAPKLTLLVQRAAGGDHQKAYDLDAPIYGSLRNACIAQI